MRTSNERGVALITTLLVMMLMAALMVGFTAVIMSDQRFRGIDRDRTQAFYAAHSGLEKLTVDLGTLFNATVAPTAAQLTAIQAAPPVIPGISYLAADGTSGYVLTAQAPSTGIIQSGSSPWAGLMALKTVYDMDSTARTAVGGEVHLSRRLETVAIPVFQFGMFSSKSLSFFAGPSFNFGGRVHTNENLFLAQGDGGTLTLNDRVTAVKEIVRQRLSNGVSLDVQHDGAVSMATAGPAGAPRNLLRTEGSVEDTVPVPPGTVNALWEGISKNTYNSWILNGDTGAKELTLPVITGTGLVRRPAVNENATDPALLAARFFSKVSLRILLSDTILDITNLPGVTPNPVPVLLDGNWNAAPPAGYGVPVGTIGPGTPPIAVSRGLTTVQMTGANVNASAAATIDLAAAIPAAWQPAPMTVTVGVPYTINCTGRDATPQFLGCTSPTGPVLVPVGSILSATTNNIASTATTNNLAALVPIAGGATIGVAAGPGTTELMKTWFWAGNQLVTCNGNSGNQLTGCNVTSTIPGGTQLSSNLYSAAGTGTIGGYIKIEMLPIAGPPWQDVTAQILNFGIGGPNRTGCASPTPNAIIQLQRLRDIDDVNSCFTAATTDSWDYWPNTLFDPREGLQRDNNPGGTDVALGGVMHYITIDVRNLSLWFQGLAPYDTGSGATANNDSGAGYSVYFSDRRNNRNAADQETGEYGFEDFINPASGTGTPNGVLDVGEDVNEDTVLDTYGQFPSYGGTASTPVPGAVLPLTVAARPVTRVAPPIAKVNRAIFFRRALKLVNGGGLGDIVMPGLTIASENPLYVQGNWNANAAVGFGGVHASTSLIADAVTLLSNGWNDSITYTFPHAMGSRNRDLPTFYRVAIIAGKGLSFPQPAGTSTDFGTDGGAHNFLRYLEDGNQPVNYRGSLVTFYYSRQATGTFKCCTTVYGAPTRNYAFDIEFLNPALLPPLTPLLRDVNVLGFSQELRPGR